MQTSAGVAVATAEDREVEDLIRRADVAMYRAKADSSVIAVYSDDEADPPRPESAG